MPWPSCAFRARCSLLSCGYSVSSRSTPLIDYLRSAFLKASLCHPRNMPFWKGDHTQGVSSYDHNILLSGDRMRQSVNTVSRNQQNPFFFTFYA
ncbi:hypothetical protein BJV77DRAFT_354234 [Russula vinacea]|nr:hypothetical protein BJV77DRAFT_354234 [Russula vinacea]